MATVDRTIRFYEGAPDRQLSETLNVAKLNT